MFCHSVFSSQKQNELTTTVEKALTADISGLILNAYISNINQQSNSPNLIITSDKGAKRSVIDQKDYQKYDPTQKPDPCRPTLFSAIDLKHSG
ncbi:unnamed protein product [Trichobilharzia regenti]|nr:unnamed protein product [Trichobilharzia regenti]